MKLGIVIGSVRETRVTDRMAKWIENEAKTMNDVETKLIDLMDLPMPLFNEAGSPRYNNDRHTDKNVQKWLDLVDGCDALVIVTPEYNRSYAPALKNAIDYLDFQLEHKPVLLASHGSTGGAQAVSHLRAVFPGVGSIATPIAVMVIGGIANQFDENGQPSEEVKNNPYGPVTLIKRALPELKWFSDALAAARK